MVAAGVSARAETDTDVREREWEAHRRKLRCDLSGRASRRRRRVTARGARAASGRSPPLSGPPVYGPSAPGRAPRYPWSCLRGRSKGGGGSGPGFRSTSRGEGRLTVLVVAGDGVGCPMRVLVVDDHHGDLELGEPFGGEADADVPSACSDRGGVSASSRPGAKLHMAGD